MFPGVSTVQEIEKAISRLSPADMRLVRDGGKPARGSLGNDDEFKGRINSSEREKAEGQRPRTG